uniref:Purple acid phosphatase n=1 Tax=Caenorhabditis japonica TaxID=281687 RepID=A0A8R1DKP1_CAEJA
MISFLLLAILLSPALASKVEQVHLSLSGDMTEMVVTWITKEPLPNVTPFVVYGVSNDALRWTGKANTTSWKSDGKEGTERYTHRATMQNLVPGDVYYYQVGSSLAMSDTFRFSQPDPSKPLRAAIFGDLSVFKGQPTIDQLISATQKNQFDIIIHIGDLAYNLHDDDGNVGDAYMNAVQPFAAHVPYMVFAGNHEVKSRFHHIVNRFTMPRNGVYDDNLFWSFDYGLVHFIAINSEYYAEEMTIEAEAQYRWLEQELKKSKATWKIVMFHRPWYCSTKSEKGCHADADKLSRKGVLGFPGLEDLLNKHKVDLILYGHKHTYERMWPIYNKKFFKSEDPGHIKNAPAPVYMLTGGAGCHSHEDPADEIPQDFSIKCLGEYGYTLLKVHNATHLYTDFVDTSVLEGKLLDPFFLEKN